MNKNKSTPPTITLANEETYIKNKTFANGKITPGLYAVSNSKLIKWLSIAEYQIAKELGIPEYEN